MTFLIPFLSRQKGSRVPGVQGVAVLICASSAARTACDLKKKELLFASATPSQISKKLREQNSGKWMCRMTFTDI
jgi:hypothetical protein